MSESARGLRDGRWEDQMDGISASSDSRRAPGCATADERGNQADERGNQTHVVPPDAPLLMSEAIRLMCEAIRLMCEAIRLTSCPRMQSA